MTTCHAAMSKDSNGTLFPPWEKDTMVIQCTYYMYNNLLYNNLLYNNLLIQYYKYPS